MSENDLDMVIAMNNLEADKDQERRALHAQIWAHPDNCECDKCVKEQAILEGQKVAAGLVEEFKRGLEQELEAEDE